MHTYSQDLRDRVLRALERGERSAEIARRLEVSRTWVHRVRARWQRDGCRSSLAVGGYRRSRVAGMEAQLRAWIEAEVDLTLAEICARLAARAGIQIKVSALWHQLDKWNLTLKKNPARRASKSARTCG